MLSAREKGGSARARRVALALRPAGDPISAQELRRREEELERLIIKAACRRAARLAEGISGPGPANGRPPAET